MRTLHRLPQVLRDQGLGKYCDPDFVRAASREMQEAMDMTAEEFDAAAHRLLEAEKAGQLRLPLAGGGASVPGAPGAATSSGAANFDYDYDDYEEEETVPLRAPPDRFMRPDPQPGDAPQIAVSGPAPPSRGRRRQQPTEDESRRRRQQRRTEGTSPGGAGTSV